jgi:3-methyladenine DNA glycosylase AlkD
MTHTELIEKIISFCKANANEANAKKYNYYFKESIDSWGLTAPQMHNEVKELLKNEKLTLETILKAAPQLIKSKKSEECSLALLLINGFGKEFNKNTFKEIESYYSYSITNWAHADTLGMFIVPKFLSNNVIDYTELKPWLSSTYKFQRRTVPVSLIKILKTTPDFTPLFQFIEPLILDTEREVHQGVGWFLREAWKKKRNETESFLLKWKDSAPRLIIQYATEKMTPEEKQRFKKIKK